jgi:hypothetical protein
MLHMMVDIKGHLLKVDKMLAKNQLDTMFKSPEFKVCPSSTVCAVIISDLHVLEWFT